MSGPLFVDRAMAAMLEGAEAATSRAFCRAAREMYPLGGIRDIECAGGAAMFYGPSDPLNGVKGVGLHGPVSAAEWDAVEAVYAPTKSPAIVDVAPTPLVDEAFFAMLLERGYRIGSFETVLWRRIDVRDETTDPVAAGLPEGVEIVVVDPEDAGVWGRVLDVGFADGGEPIKFAVDIGKVRGALAQSVMLLAMVEGVPAGGAGMSVHGEVVHMAGAAVMPAFRGRGLQRALTQARLRIARERGCRMAKMDVRAGTVSNRNAVRSGFAVAYTRPQMIRTWAP